MPVSPDNDRRLSVLYGAIGHGNNMALGPWLLEHGANPNDNESLYHATEPGHHAGLGMLLAHGADPRGTNALLRAPALRHLESSAPPPVATAAPTRNSQPTIPVASG